MMTAQHAETLAVKDKAIVAHKQAHADAVAQRELEAAALRAKQRELQQRLQQLQDELQAKTQELEASGQECKAVRAEAEVLRQRYVPQQHRCQLTLSVLFGSI